jgi:hypothetical protein
MFFLVKNSKGQSAVEFLLIAPILFLIFFAIVQLAYMAYVSFAVQRAALAVARTASLSGPNNSAAFKTQLIVSLLPIVQLNQKTLLTVLSSDCETTVSPDYQQITTLVRYPMPVWVPLVGNVFGEPVDSSTDYNQTPEGQTVKEIFQLLDKTPPNLSFQGVRMPVVWISYEATTFNEAYSR